MSNDILDLAELKERVQDDIELLLELLDIFTEDYKGKRVVLGKSLVSDNYEEVRNVAHSLRGASGNISAKSLREKLSTFEEMGAKNDTTGSDELLQALDKSYTELEGRIAEVKVELAG
ncbi:MAG: HPt (histidine-containing phosphotransfer) domain-containing protein [Lysobacterales bacterium]|jgi:HPt (histidine-containing phosphotransfer) domain-containing protein